MSRAEELRALAGRFVIWAEQEARCRALSIVDENKFRHAGAEDAYNECAQMARALAAEAEASS